MATQLLRPAAPSTSGDLHPILPDLAYLRTAIVNVFFVGAAGAGDREWTLVDTGMYGYTGTIMEAARERFGPGSRPNAIVLTHGHFDHVGTVRELAQAWDVPVYAHPLELPYLTGRSAYPPPDPSVGGGAMAALAWTYPKHPIDLGSRVRALPADGSVPGMTGWRWVHTPGHTAGHVSLFRDADRTLLAGDAVITTKQESALAVMRQEPELHGPPAYFTQDWIAAERSALAIAELAPELVATGHGVPLRGAELPAALADLARHFRQREVPPRGRYVGQPAVADERGVVSVPPPTPAETGVVLGGMAAAVVTGMLIGRAVSGRRGR